MKTLTLHIELFAFHSFLFRLKTLLCRTTRCAQPSVPEVNLIRTNILCGFTLQKFFCNNLIPISKNNKVSWLSKLLYKYTNIISKCQVKKII